MQVHRRQVSAFTLVELMISLFMVALLMVGINMVFKLASDTVGIGQRTIAMSQDIRAVQSTMEDDTRRWLPDAPAFIIVNERIVDPKDSSIFHRRDFFAFPARGLYRRQTGANSTSYTSQTASYEAWIWYGATVPLPTPQVPNPLPGDVIGRFAVLMKDPLTISNENFIQRSNILLSPLGIGSRPANDKWMIQESVYDLAGATLDQFRQDVQTARNLSNNGNEQNANWWQPLFYRFQCEPRLPKPIYPVAAAQASPYFVGNCSEFVVEFAGDYFTQDSNGNINNPSAGPDGQLDFMYVNGKRQIRWYGLDRDTFGDKKPTVMPVRAMANLVPYFEREYVPGNSVDAYGRYTCVWANEAPKLVRISMKLEDPSGRIQDGPWSEFVLGPQ